MLVSLYRRGRVYYLKYAAQTGLPRRSLGTSDRKKAEAIRVAEEHRLLFVSFGVEQRPLERVRFSECIVRFMDHKRASGLREGSLEGYLFVLNRFGKSLKHDLSVDSITIEHVERYILEASDARRSRKSIRNEIFILNTFFVFAVERNYVRTNPLARMKKPRPVHHEPRPLSPEQFRALMAEMKGDPVFADYVRFYTLTGIRRADGPMLRDGVHVDMGARTLTLPQQKQGNYKQLMISDELLPVLGRLLARKDPSGRFILMHKADLSKRFRRYATRAQLPAHITFHSLRHTFGSWLARGGVGLSTLQRLMGHSDWRSTAGYVGAFDEGLRTALEQLRLPVDENRRHKSDTLPSLTLENRQN